MKSSSHAHHPARCWSLRWAMPRGQGTHFWFELMAKCHLTPIRSIPSCGEECKGSWGCHPVCTDLEVDLLLPLLIEREEHQESLVHTPRGCCYCRFTPRPTLGLADILLSASPTVFLCQVIFPALSPLCFSARWFSERCRRPTPRRTRTARRPRRSWRSPTCGCGCCSGRAVPAWRPARPRSPRQPCTTPSTTSSSRAAASAMATPTTASLSLDSGPPRRLAFSMWYVHVPNNVSQHNNTLQESRILKIVRDRIEYGVGPSMQYLTFDALNSKHSEQKWSLQRGWSPCGAEVLNFLCVLVWDSHPFQRCSTVVYLFQVNL